MLPVKGILGAFIRFLTHYAVEGKGIACAWCRPVKILEGKISTKYPMKKASCFTSHYLMALSARCMLLLACLLGHCEDLHVVVDEGRSIQLRSLHF
jgi:hypothetical protein